MSLNTVVSEMSAVADHLVPYTYPMASFQNEQQILCLKQRIVRADGYETILCFSKANYTKYMLLSLQIQGYEVPFLPFTLICKLGRIFLGSRHLSFIDFMRNNRKVYCWAIKSLDGELLPPDKQAISVNYEGFEFSVLQPGAVDLL